MKTIKIKYISIILLLVDGIITTLLVGLNPANAKTETIGITTTVSCWDVPPSHIGEGTTWKRVCANGTKALCKWKKIKVPPHTVGNCTFSSGPKNPRQN